MNHHQRFMMLKPAVESYKRWIDRKPDRLLLTMEDLLRARNAKGGNGSICEEDENLVNQKLFHYSFILAKIQCHFIEQNLSDLRYLQHDQIQKLADFARQFLDLTQMPDTAIVGFGPSTASMILHCYFPDLFPVMDYISLNQSSSLNHLPDSQQRNPHHPEVLYYNLLMHCHMELIADETGKLTLRDLDERFFKDMDVRPIPNTFYHTKIKGTRILN